MCCQITQRIMRSVLGRPGRDGTGTSGILMTSMQINGEAWKLHEWYHKGQSDTHPLRAREDSVNDCINCRLGSALKKVHHR